MSVHFGSAGSMRVLIVDDEPSVCHALRELCRDEGAEVRTAASTHAALASTEDFPADLLFLDVRLPGQDGLSALPELRRRLPDHLFVTVMTAFGDLPTAVRAVQEGAHEYLLKPFHLDQAIDVIRRARARLEHDARAAPNVDSDSSGDPAWSNSPSLGMGGDGEMIGSSLVMQQVFRQIALVAPTNAPVLVTGESGVGKELVAEAVHRHSLRAKGPFVAVSLGALNPGLIESELFGHVRGAFTGADHDRIGLLEQAHGGTIFLDELGEVPLSVQAKLLRALERREVTPVGDPRPRPADFRIVAATHRRLSDMISAGSFRADLFYRLSVFQIAVPPLRDRLDDLPELAQAFARRAGGGPLTPAALESLARRHWAGNVRELRNVVERGAILSQGQAIGPQHLTPVDDGVPISAASVASTSASNSISANESARAVETTEIDAAAVALQAAVVEWTRSQLQSTPAPSQLHASLMKLVEPPLFEAVLAFVQGRRNQAAEILGLHRGTLRLKLREQDSEAE